MYKQQAPYTFPGSDSAATVGCNNWRAAAVWMDQFSSLHTHIGEIIHTVQPVQNICCSSGLEAECDQVWGHRAEERAERQTQVSEFPLVPREHLPRAPAAR